jgi:hypothetical protein
MVAGPVCTRPPSPRMQKAFALEREAYLKAIKEATHWRDSSASGPSRASRTATPEGPSSGQPPTLGSAGPPSDLSPASPTSRPASRSRCSSRSKSDKKVTICGVCPVEIPVISEPLPDPGDALPLLQSLAALYCSPDKRHKLKESSTAAPHNPPTKAELFSVSSAAMIFPLAKYMPAPRPPLDAPHPPAPPNPLPVNGYLWNAWGRTAMLKDGFDLDPLKLPDLEATAAERAEVLALCHRTQEAV